MAANDFKVFQLLVDYKNRHGVVSHKKGSFIKIKNTTISKMKDGRERVVAPIFPKKDIFYIGKDLAYVDKPETVKARFLNADAGDTINSAVTGFARKAYFVSVGINAAIAALVWYKTKDKSKGWQTFGKVWVGLSAAQIAYSTYKNYKAGLFGSKLMKETEQEPEVVEQPVKTTTSAAPGGSVSYSRNTVSATPINVAAPKRSVVRFPPATTPQDSKFQTILKSAVEKQMIDGNRAKILYNRFINLPNKTHKDIAILMFTSMINSPIPGVPQDKDVNAIYAKYNKSVVDSVGKTMGS